MATIHSTAGIGQLDIRYSTIFKFSNLKHNIVQQEASLQKFSAEYRSNSTRIKYLVILTYNICKYQQQQASSNGHIQPKTTDHLEETLQATYSFKQQWGQQPMVHRTDCNS